MNVFHDITLIFHKILAEMGFSAADIQRITVEPPREASHGDLACNAAMVLAKQAGEKPRVLAEKICAHLMAQKDIFADVTIAGPGFINIRLCDAVWQNLPRAILRAGNNYGRSDMGAGETLNVEYVSTNPTGPIHLGHTRVAVVGDALAGLLEFAGFDVLREFYINDAGGQIETLARSALWRAREAAGEKMGDMPEEFYPGDYLIPAGETLLADYGREFFEKNDEAAQIKAAKSVVVPMMMEMIKDDLACLDIEHACFVSEQSLRDNGAVDDALDVLQQKGLIYQGVLAPPKGEAPPDDWEARPQTLFRATQFGDDTDRPLKKADGSLTYFAPDIAYHYDKFRRGFTRMVNVWGADHGGYVTRIDAAVAAITDKRADLQVKICQIVRLMREGEPVKMSKRAGNFVTLRELVNEVGKDAVRFFMLMRKNDAPLDFDFELAKQQSRDNPVFYVQYAYARICSVFRNADKLGIVCEDIDGVDLSLLTHEAEHMLIKQMGNFPRQVESAARHYEPHRIAFYVQELAAQFHSLWNAGKENIDLRFIQEEKPAHTQARLALLRACAITFENASSIIGISLSEEMR